MKRFLLGIGILSLTMPLYAQDLPAGSVDVNLDVVSNHVWRGSDLYMGAAKMNKKAYGSATGVPAFQPSLQFNTPVDGLYLNLFMSFALANRGDTDVDGEIQPCAAGKGDSTGGALGKCGDTMLSNAIISGIKTGADVATTLNNDINSRYAAFSTGSTSELFANTLASSNTKYGGAGQIGYHKEPVGLKRIDELDFTLGYGRQTSAGFMGGGIVAYRGVNTKGRDSFNSTEVFITYGLPQLEELTLTVWANIVPVAPQYNYYQLKYAPSFKLSESMSLHPYLSAGYQQFQDLQGMRDVTSGVTLAISGFRIGLNATYRPNLAIQEQFSLPGDTNANIPVWLNGGSTVYDGQVPDPSKQYGFVNLLTNSLIQQYISAGTPFTYTYTPRTKLPRSLYWMNLGYTISF